MTVRTFGGLACFALVVLACGSSAGSDGSGGGGGSSGAGGSSGGGDLDPAPVTPDLTGLVPASSKWVLFTEANGSFVPVELKLADLASGGSAVVNPNGPDVSYTSWSPDGSTFLVSSADADSDSSLHLIRLTDHGYVPAALVGGYGGVRGNFSLFEWDERSRFVVATRGGSGDRGVEVIDAARGMRVGHFELEGSFSASFAPAGYYFSFYHSLVDPLIESSVARVTNDGTSDPFTLEADAFGPVFDPTGTRVFYGTGHTGARGLKFIDLPGSAAKVATITQPGEIFTGSYFAPSDGRSVLVANTRASGLRVHSRYYFDGTPPLLDVTDPAKSAGLTFETPDGGLMLVDYMTALDLVRLDPYARFALPGLLTRNASGYFTGGVWGHRAFYQGGGQLRIASIDDTGILHDAAVSDAGVAATPCISDFSYEPADKLVFGQDDGKLVFVDLSGATPSVVGSMTPSAADLELGCPLWAPDDSAFAVTERGASGSKLYVVPWSGPAPGAPVLAIQSTQPLTPRALMYR